MTVLLIPLPPPLVKNLEGLSHRFDGKENTFVLDILSLGQ